ncbi:hypothetical protein [Methylobacterium trifolii]|uniref:Transmembrane protein n=1 Tax=Methylobacterium trifolii TaxID=1003092 RepID=A0ABQ4U387_9HYPH|nr:hypothetical protein [Methylobacterium trifolii]GJE61885.1 hypothetical protein MPOCJGCO_4011 [Methylobacterium trifolii]
MRKIAILSATALSIAALTATAADARPRGYYGGGYGHHAYGGGYGYRGGRRGIGTGAAVGLGIAGLAAGAIAAGAARDAYYDRGYGYGGYGNGYGYAAPAYGGYYGYPY